jgi:hypothetical protein
MNRKKRLGLVIGGLTAMPFIAVLLFAQGYPMEAALAYINGGSGWTPWNAVLAGGVAPGYPLRSIELYCKSGSTIAPCNPSAGGGTVDGTSLINTAGVISINPANPNNYSAAQTMPTVRFTNGGSITDDSSSLYMGVGNGGGLRMNNTNWMLHSTGVYEWTSGNLFVAVDSGASRVGAGSIAFGNGTQGDKSATVSMAQTVLGPALFASLPTCVSGIEGAERAVTNSTTVTFNATITGGGTNHVHAYCNGTNWVVQ